MNVNLDELRDRAKRDNVVAYFDQGLARAALEGDGWTLTGLAAVFNTWAPIDDWEGTFNERINPRAFNKTLREKADQVVSMFNHGQDPVFGQLPIGKPAVMEPQRAGLYTETPLNRTPLNEMLREAVRSQSISGMSIQFRVIQDTWDEGGDIPTRTIDQLELYEFGPVVFPAYPTTTTGLRAAQASKLIPHDARIHTAVNMAAATRGTDDPSAATADGATVPTDALHQQIADRLAEQQADLERQAREMERYG